MTTYVKKTTKFAEGLKIKRLPLRRFLHMFTRTEDGIYLSGGKERYQVPNRCTATKLTDSYDTCTIFSLHKLKINDVRKTILSNNVDIGW